MPTHRSEQHLTPSASTPGLKVASLSKPRFAQSFSQSSSADAGPSSSSPAPRRSSETSPISGCKTSSRAEEINAQTVVIYCLLCSGRGGKKEENQLQIELSLFEPGQLKKKKAEVTETIYDNGTIYSDLSKELIRHHKRQADRC